MSAASLFGGLGLAEGTDSIWRHAAIVSEMDNMLRIVRSWLISALQHDRQPESRGRATAPLPGLRVPLPSRSPPRPGTMRVLASSGSGSAR